MRHWQMESQSGTAAPSYSLISNRSTCRRRRAHTPQRRGGTVQLFLELGR